MRDTHLSHIDLPAGRVNVKQIESDYTVPAEMRMSGSNTAIQSPAPDLDQIPTRLIERVDVVTGGASATYGSDAIAGVINFIMRRDFEGLEIDATYGFNQHDNDNDAAQTLARDAGFEPNTGSTTDGDNRSVNLLFGMNSADGQGNLTGYLGYQDMDPVTSGKRDFGTCQVDKDTDDDGVPTGTVSCGGSSNSNYFQPKSGPNGLDPEAVYNVFGNNFRNCKSPVGAIFSSPVVYPTYTLADLPAAVAAGAPASPGSDSR
jgi:hypothetical protein